MRTFAQWLAENKPVFRVDSQRIDDFSPEKRTYFLTQQGSGPVQDTSRPPDWAAGQQGEFKKGLFAGDYKDVLSYLIPRHLPWLVHHTKPKKTLYYNLEDQQEMQDYRPFLSSFDPKGFTKLDRQGQGEYFSENPPKPLKQAQIRDPLRILGQRFNLVPLKDLRELQDKHRELVMSGQPVDAEGEEFN